ncbi:hypothetical protein IT401_02455 [Candidatus Nomurabacteria bacterium]|nr:hypothetical protein [Candidatus Nomurabacteria bacterium]
MIPFRRAQHPLRRMAIYSFAALFLLSQLLTLTTPVLAQSTTPEVKQLRDLPNAATTVNKLSNQSDTNVYANFFANDATLKLGAWGTTTATQPQKASDITFSLNAKFNLNQQNTGNAPEWFWNRISNESSDKPAFVMRFCDVGDNGMPLEESCKFGQVPYRYQLEDEPAISSLVSSVGDYDVINQTVPINAGVLPQLQEAMNNLLARKIYRYGINVLNGGSSYSEALTSGFVVNFNPGESGGVIVGNLDTKALVAGKRYQADVWTCASDLEGTGIIGSNADNDDYLKSNVVGTGQNVRVFDGYRCEDSPSRLYFRVAGFQFTIPSTDQEAATISSTTQTYTAADANAVMINPNRDILPTCAWFGFSGTIVGCFARGVYYLLYQPIAFIAGLFGQLFDFFLGYSISDEAYRMPFAVQAWKLIRDITNIFFILILVYTGFAAVFGSEKVSMKKIVPQLILNAILINFSLVATRTVIDISNVATRVFYNTMRVTNKETNQDIEVAGYKSVSTILVSAFNPQKIFSAAMVSNQSATNSSNTNCGNNSSGCVDNNAGTLDPNAISQGASASAKNIDLGSAEYAGYFIILCIIAAVIMGGVAAMFWTVAIFFLGRTVGFYVGMIFSPFAFLTRSMPFFDKLETIKWGDWTKELIKNAALGPVFLLFLYVIVLFANSGVKTIISGNSFFETVISVVVPMLILYFLMKQAVNIAKNYAGKFGLSIQKTVEKTIGGGAGAVVGAGLGLATGGASFLGTRAAGMLKLSENSRTKLQEQRAAGGISGRLASMRLGLNDAAQKGTWDFRNTKAFNTIQNNAKSIGLPLEDRLSRTLGLGKDTNKGGIKAVEKKEKEEAKKKIESIKTDLSDKEAAEFWKKRVYDRAYKEADEERVRELRATGKTDAEIKEMRSRGTFTNRTYNDAVFDKVKMQMEERKVETNKQLTQALREEFAKTISEGKTLGQQMAAPIGALATGAAGTTLGAAGMLSNPVAAPMMMAVAYDQNRKARTEKSVAEKYIKDAKEARAKGKLPKEDRLEKEKADIEKKLENLNAYFDRISKNFGGMMDAMIDEANAGNPALAKFRGRAKGSYSKDDYDDVANYHRQELQARTNALQMDIENVNNEYVAAQRAGNIHEAANHKARRDDLLRQKQQQTDELENFSEQRRSRLEGDLAKKENELEKIKEKNEKTSDKSGDKKKEEKKDEKK